MAKHPWYVNNYMNIVNSGAINVGAPIWFKRVQKPITIGGVTYLLDVPGSQDLDLEELVAKINVTAETGTAQTCDFDLQGCVDPLSNHTTINEGATFAANDTTLTVTAGAGIGSGSLIEPVLLAEFEAAGNVRRLVGYEWALVTNVSTNDLTVTRGIFGTAARAFPNGAFVFYSKDWVTAKDSAGNNIFLNDLATDGATAAAPVIGQLQLSGEGLTGFPYPAARIRQAAPNSGNITYNVDLYGRTR